MTSKRALEAGALEVPATWSRTRRARARVWREQETSAGQAYVIEPGHDAWVVGDEPVVGFEFESQAAEEYAKN